MEDKPGIEAIFDTAIAKDGRRIARANGHDTAVPAEFKTLAEFCREYVPLAYAVEPLLRTSALYTLTARTGHGKTAFLIVAAWQLLPAARYSWPRSHARPRRLFDIRKPR